MNELIVNDVQSKKVVTLERLMGMNVIIPDIQRVLDEDSMNEIIEYQKTRLTRYGSFLFLGDLVLAQQGQSTDYILVDGQHRYSAMKSIYTLQPNYNISLLIVSVNSTFSIEDVFILLNKSKPVPEYVIQTTLDMGKRYILTQFQELFKKKYKAYISKANSPRKPNINIQNLLDLMSESPVINFFLSGEKIFKYMQWANINQWKPNLDQKTIKLCMDKTTNPEDALFMCSDKELAWIYKPSLMEEYLTINYSEKTTPTQYKKKQIPKSVRTNVWKNLYDTNTNGKCICCLSDITCFNFEAGHIVAEANGGSSFESNLRPICRKCNQSMGTMNMNDFAKKYYNRVI